jgi:hypothetical protein
VGNAHHLRFGQFQFNKYFNLATYFEFYRMQ